VYTYLSSYYVIANKQLLHKIIFVFLCFLWLFISPWMNVHSNYSAVLEYIRSLVLLHERRIILNLNATDCRKEVRMHIN
jgi:hypothetical protein